MGIIRKSLGGLGAILGTAAGGAAYLSTRTNIITPLPADDEIWATESYARFNPHRNPSAQDFTWKRLPLSKIRPELRDSEEAIATEFCRGAWSGYAYTPQRVIMALARKNQPETKGQLFDREQLASSKYEIGTRFSDGFEVVERSSNSVTVRAGGSPRESGLRESDGLLVLSAKVNREAETVDVGIKSAFFNSTENGKEPAPFIIELLHRYYARAMVDSGVRRLTGSSS